MQAQMKTFGEFAINGRKGSGQIPVVAAIEIFSHNHSTHPRTSLATVGNDSNRYPAFIMKHFQIEEGSV
jgi:hypothetical protein